MRRLHDTVVAQDFRRSPLASVLVWTTCSEIAQMTTMSEGEYARQTAVQIRQHALRSWADANVLAGIGSKSNALLLRMLAVETLLKITHAADRGATPSELQHASIDRLFWCASASHQRAMMES